MHALNGMYKYFESFITTEYSSVDEFIVKVRILVFKIEFKIEANKKLLRIIHDEIRTVIHHFYHILLVLLQKNMKASKRS